MILKEELKNKRWSCLNENQLGSLLDEMLKQIGHVDPELRDELIYPAFVRIIDDGLLTDAQFLSVLKTCLDERHLFFRIGEKNTDSVFTRSFSSLVIAALLTADQKTKL